MDDAVDAATEQVRTRDARVLDAPLLVAGLVVRTRAKLPSQEHVLDALRINSLLERLPIELGVEAAIRHRAHIRKRGHAMALQERHECPQGVRGVSDGQHRMPGSAHAPAPGSRSMMAATSL